tara:strand:- start:1147 stop:1365 length:219 start_codon:yes stop_codon:yes gene_type:complete
MQKRFKLAPKPLFFIYVVPLALFRSAWFSALAKLYSFAIFGLCVGCCELQMCMALALAIVSIFQLKLITDKS